MSKRKQWQRRKKEQQQTNNQTTKQTTTHFVGLRIAHSFGRFLRRGCSFRRNPVHRCTRRGHRSDLPDLGGCLPVAQRFVRDFFGGLPCPDVGGFLVSEARAGGGFLKLLKKVRQNMSKICPNMSKYVEANQSTSTLHRAKVLVQR